ncbi:amidotransferase [Pseudomonas putida]|uniref:amidotransferase n=1 Tax=Pseudomonas putida TaxID=303 RepID=UPI00334D8D8D
MGITVLRLCVLETDVLREELKGDHKSYGEMFRRLFSRQTQPVELFVYNVIDGEYPPVDSKFDGYLVTGSKFDAFSDLEWILKLKDYLMRLYRAGEKLIGVCFGHQLLALTLGGEVARSEQGWGLGVHSYKVEKQEEWMHPPLPIFSLYVSHQDQVFKLPAGAQSIASSSFCPYAAFTVGNQVLCFQGHPEFTEAYTKALLDLRVNLLGRDFIDSAIRTMEIPEQGQVIAEWIARFIAAGAA